MTVTAFLVKYEGDSQAPPLNFATQCIERLSAGGVSQRVVQDGGFLAPVVPVQTLSEDPSVCVQTSLSALSSSSTPRSKQNLMWYQLHQTEGQAHLCQLPINAIAGTLTFFNQLQLHFRALGASVSILRTAGHRPVSLPQYSQLVCNPPSIPRPQPLLRSLSMTPPVYNGVNPNYPGLHVLNTSPPIFAVDNFLTPYECDFLINAALDAFGPAPVVGKGAGEISPSRTSSTCYLAREDLGDLMRKVSLLTGKPAEHCELPQVGRYFYQEKYLQHFDAFDLSTEDGRRFAANGGQRTVTVLIYLNDVMRGGATRFPTLNLDVQPRRGMALVFFPATVDGLLDKMALHAALPAIDTKFVSQVWIRQSTYNGQPSKRLQQTLGAPISLLPQMHPQIFESTAAHPNSASPTANIVWNRQAQSTIPMQL